MAKRAADLSQFQVNIEKPPEQVTRPAPKKAKHTPAASLITKGFRVKPEAARQFDMLKAEISGENGKDKGPALIAEALNLLFKKHGKPPVA